MVKADFNILLVPKDLTYPKIYFLKELRIILSLGLLICCATACTTNPPKKDASVYIRETSDGYQLIRNGKPFYIKGAAGKGFLKELKEAGGNTLRVYDTLDLEETLTKADSLGLAVVVDIPIPKFYNSPEYYEDEKLFKEVKELVAQIVTRYHSYPALLYWNLGNELYYPYLYKSTPFFKNYNKLIDLIHQIDPNHPVSTTTIGANKLRVLSITSKSPELDFISFNSFGVLSSFSKKLKPITPIWDGPHVISEWGVNGPWEVPVTSWNAPIEETSTKKAEQIRNRFISYIQPMKGKGSLGSFIFYWNKKNEITPSWYSLFGEEKQKTQAVYELQKIWKGKNENEKFIGPEIEYLLLNGKGAAESIILTPDSEAEAKLFLPGNKNQNFKIEWEIRPESWYKTGESRILKGIQFRIDGKHVKFKTPKKEGPYRLYVYLRNSTEFYATANVPFYILNPENAE